MKNNKNITLLWLLIFMSSTQWVSAQMFGGRPIMKKPSVTVNCNASGNGFAGNFMAGTSIAGSSYIVIVTNNTSDQIVINFAAADLQITGVTGLTVGTPTGSPALNGSGNATINGGSSVTVTYPLTGTLPNTCGNFTGTWTKLTPLTLSCQKVQSITPSNFLKAVTGITFSGNNKTGFTVNWNAISGATEFTLEHSTTKSGPWTAFPSNPYTGTSASITGLSSGNILFYRITVIGGTCDGASLIRSVDCGAFIAPGQFKTFLCHNLGADTTVDPNVGSILIQGGLLRWGFRGPNITGDSREDFLVSPNNGPLGFMAAPTATNLNDGFLGNFGATISNDFAWRSSTGQKTAADPCPTDYRVPTGAEFIGLIENNVITRNGTWVTSSTNFFSLIHFGPNTTTKTLTLPAAGRADATDRGSKGYYWASDNPAIVGLRSNNLEFNHSAQGQGVNNSDRDNYYSIRCIQE